MRFEVLHPRGYVRHVAMGAVVWVHADGDWVADATLDLHHLRELQKRPRLWPAAARSMAKRAVESLPTVEQ